MFTLQVFGQKRDTTKGSDFHARQKRIGPAYSVRQVDSSPLRNTYFAKIFDLWRHWRGFSNEDAVTTTGFAAAVGRSLVCDSALLVWRRRVTQSQGLQSPGTPVGTYTLTVTATSGSTTRSQNLTLVVQ
jgi:hypothetical protein